MRSLLVLLLILHVSDLHATDPDSLTKNVPYYNHKNFGFLIQQAEAVKETNNRLAVLYINRALRLPADSGRIVSALTLKGTLLFAMDEFDSAKDVLLIVARKKETPQNHVEVGTAANLLCEIHTFQGDFRKALQYGYQARRIFEENDQNALSASLYNNLGLLYFRMQNFAKAIQFYKKSLEHDLNSPEAAIARRYFNLALSYAAVDSVDKAFESVKTGMKSCPGCSREITARGAHAMGMINYTAGNKEDAFGDFRKSLVHAGQGSSMYQSDNLRMIGQIYLDRGQYDSALHFLNRAEKVSNEIKCDKCLENVYETLIAVYKGQEKAKEQTVYLKKYIDLKDRMVNADLMRELAIVEGKHLEKEHLTQLAFQKEQLAQQETMLKYQLLKAGLVGVLCVLLIVVVLYQIRTVRIKKNIHVRLEMKVHERVKILEEKKRAVLAQQQRKREKMQDFVLRVNEKLDKLGQLMGDDDAEVVEGMRAPVRRLQEALGSDFSIHQNDKEETPQICKVLNDNVTEI